jgi:hypothetical protein
MHQALSHCPRVHLCCLSSTSQRCALTIQCRSEHQRTSDEETQSLQAAPSPPAIGVRPEELSGRVWPAGWGCQEGRKSRPRISPSSSSSSYSSLCPSQSMGILNTRQTTHISHHITNPPSHLSHFLFSCSLTSDTPMETPSDRPGYTRGMPSPELSISEDGEKRGSQNGREQQSKSGSETDY